METGNTEIITMELCLSRLINACRGFTVNDINRYICHKYPPRGKYLSFSTHLFHNMLTNAVCLHRVYGVIPTVYKTSSGRRTRCCQVNQDIGSSSDIAQDSDDRDNNDRVIQDQINLENKIEHWFHELERINPGVPCEQPPSDLLDFITAIYINHGWNGFTCTGQCERAQSCHNIFINECVPSCMIQQRSFTHDHVLDSTPFYALSIDIVPERFK